MKEPELSFFQQLIAFAGLAGFGGVVNYLTTLKTGKKFKWPSFFIELICSAFVGVVIGCWHSLFCTLWLRLTIL
jgi:hypothetical protein